METHSKLLLAGVLVPLAGTLPILLYIVFGPANGNPIGLGLLAWLSWLVGAILLLVGFIGYLSSNK